jgi:hypothetical protein
LRVAHRLLFKPVFTRLLIASLILFCASWLSGCRKPSPSPADTVASFYEAYRGDYRQADTAQLSRGLADALRSAAKHEKISAAATKAGPFPTDKPDILEGDVFSGLYEGYTGFKIGRVVNDRGRATVEVNFTNSGYHTNWVDEVVLIDQSGWKIDDVSYGGSPRQSFGLREVLREFAGSGDAAGEAGR